ncbi:hypothetical protein OKW33_006098 [Paraburkholderia atlantica]|uniref:Uncharacterized protein n=1 Tax=Paraburkholderia atlantica TaxID=2654982 RepID=A0A7W8QGE7_PARAM|nr:hypothetical protein [Paraburkholderia atlantica]
MYFVKAQVMPMWRYGIVDLLRHLRRAGSAAGAENVVPDKSGVEPLAGSSLRRAMDRPFCAIVGQPYPQRELPWPVYQTPAAVAVEAEALRRLSTVGVGQSADAALDSGKLFRGHAERPAFHHPGCSGSSRSTKRVHTAVDRLKQLLAVRVRWARNRRARRSERWRGRFSRQRARRSRWRLPTTDTLAKSPRKRHWTKALSLSHQAAGGQNRLCAGARCWVVERSFGWLNRFRRLASD